MSFDSSMMRKPNLRQGSDQCTAENQRPDDERVVHRRLGSDGHRAKLAAHAGDDPCGPDGHDESEDFEDSGDDHVYESSARVGNQMLVQCAMFHLVHETYSAGASMRQ
jgi:hypothetical protein